MAYQKITKTIADNAAGQTSRYTIWDADVSGFGLRVTPSGSRSWVLKYRADGGGRTAPTRWLTLGSYPALNVADARAAARRAHAEITLGKDPAGDLAAKRREMTMAMLIDFYEVEGCVVQRGIRQGEPMKDTTKTYTLARLRHHVVPILGRKRAAEISEGDIETFYRAVANGKTARDDKEDGRRIIVRGGPGAARKVVRDLSAVFSFAKRHRIVMVNPVENASVRKTDNKRERFLSTAEIECLGRALDELEREGINPKAIDITRLWALSGCRRNEIAGLLWTEVDFERGLLILDDSKTGKSIRPLGTAARELLVVLHENQLFDSPYVFPAERGEGYYQGTKKVWPEVTKRAKLPGITPHTLRHTLGAVAGSSGEAMLLIGAVLGHSNARSTQIYAHIEHDPAKLAADRITGPISDALNARSREPAV